MWFDNPKSSGRKLFVDARSRRTGYKANGRLATRGERLDRVTLAILIPVAVAGVLVLLGFAFVELGEAFYTENPRYTIQTLKIDIKPGRMVSEREVRDWTQIQEGKNIFGFNARKIRANVLSHAPNVKAMAITRELPGTVMIQVTERDPVARLGSKTSLFAADRDGYVLNLGAAASQMTLPVVVGYGGDSMKLGDVLRGQAMAALEALDGCNDPRLCLRVDSIDISQDGVLLMAIPLGSLTQQVRLAWKGMGTGTPESRQNLLRKLNYVAQVQQSPDGRKLAKLDVTHDGSRVYGSSNP